MDDDDENMPEEKLMKALKQVNNKKALLKMQSKLK